MNRSAITLFILFSIIVTQFGCSEIASVPKTKISCKPPKQISIIPKPKGMKVEEGFSLLNENTSIVASTDAEPMAKYLAETLKPATCFELEISSAQDDKDLENAISINITEDEFDLGPEDFTPKMTQHVLGVEACLWYTGHKWSKEVAIERLGPRHQPKLEFIDQMVWAKLSALAEVSWSTKEKDYEEFSERLKAHIDRLDRLGVEKADFTPSL